MVGSGKTASEANGNNRGAAEYMCTAGDLGKVRGGSEQDKARKEGTAPSAPARASAHERRVFVPLDYYLCCSASPLYQVWEEFYLAFLSKRLR